MQILFIKGELYPEKTILKVFNEMFNNDPNATINFYGVTKMIGHSFISIITDIDYSFIKKDDDQFECIYVSQMYRIIITSLVDKLQSRVINITSKEIIDKGELDYLLRLYFDRKHLVVNYKEAFNILMDTNEKKAIDHVGNH